jgi:murein DD-endopeptidase MepM/ murein hydrolase activator NlpD
VTRIVAAALLLGGCVAAAAPPSAPISAPAPIAATPPAPVAEIQLEGRLEQGGLAFGIAPPGTTGLRLGNDPVSFGADRRFVIGFDRDAPAVLMLEARLSDGSTLVRQIAVARRAWAIERVDVPKRPGVTNETFERLRAPEVARINAARALTSVSNGWRQSFIWPAVGRTSGVFGAQRIYRGGEEGAYHSGVDIAGGAGAPVTAPADGVVVLAAAKPFTLEGNLLIIDHGMGLNSAFLHLSRIDVREGDRVFRGQRVGAIGSSGRATGPHLHWAVKWRSARVDPARLVEKSAEQDRP